MESNTLHHATETRLLLEGLLAALGPSALLCGADMPARNHNDYSGLQPSPPLAVVRPADAAGVATTLSICHAHGVPVVPQGGMTGLCGGARAAPDQVALSLERLVGIEELDAAAATMTVLAGTPLETIQQAAASAGFLPAGPGCTRILRDWRQPCHQCGGATA